MTSRTKASTAETAASTIAIATKTAGVGASLGLSKVAATTDPASSSGQMTAFEECPNSRVAKTSCSSALDRNTTDFLR
jgi:hypothetical protein